MRARSWTRIFPIRSFELLCLLHEPAPTPTGPPRLLPIDSLPLPAARRLGLLPGRPCRLLRGRRLVLLPLRPLRLALLKGPRQGGHEVLVAHAPARFRLGEREAGADLHGPLLLPLVELLLGP